MDLNEQDKPWSHDLDAKKDILDVHDKKIKEFLGKDFKHAKLEQKDKDLIIDIFPLALAGAKMCPNPDIGADIFDIDMAPLQALAIVQFNRADNPVLSLFAPEGRNVEEDQKGNFEKIWDKLKGKTTQPEGPI